MKDCLFCKIIRGEIPSTKVFENEKVLGFKDIQPCAKIHNLFIHKEHTTNLKEMPSSQLVDLFEAIKEWSETSESLRDGFRVVSNVGEYAGQTVFHTHFHVLGGELLGDFGAHQKKI